eukprot:CAMPEP_0171769014 /NCGR_PEP_ID=MMETSP0991-20121206/52720_1 /TAXON_ID=483369 /ORGANISM="non described non described, Strain CCMP2098" /LENGTH=346 /DNA_ID=CAMNT_0012374029 /DNA_START=71 /DNA_END=1109 /DNA_ORIENTATION=-
MVPVQPGLLLAPLFVGLGVCSHFPSQEALSLVSAVHFVGNGVVGALSWSTRDVRFISCGALWVVVPFTWLGFLIGSTEHLRLVEWLPPPLDEPNGSDSNKWRKFENEAEATQAANDDDEHNGGGGEGSSALEGEKGSASRMLLEAGFRYLSSASSGDEKGQGGGGGGSSRDTEPLRDFEGGQRVHDLADELRAASAAHVFAERVWVKVRGSAQVAVLLVLLGGAHQGVQYAGHWFLVVLVAFFSGYLFLANLEAGVAITTFLSLSLFLGMETKRAIPTAIVIAGWSNLAPLVAYWFYIQSEPFVRLLLVLPGLWLGGCLAPWLNKAGGPTCNLACTGFTALAVGTA